MSPIERGQPFSETATHGTLAVASHTAVAGKTFHITKITVSSDKAGAICLVKQGTTTLWQFQLMVTAAGKSVHSEEFVPPLRGVTGALVSVEIDGTSACKANLQGYEL